MDHGTDPTDLLAAADRLARDVGVDPWRALMLVMTDHLRRLELPAAAAAALDVARHHWQGRLDPAGLARAKVACWAYLDEAFEPGTDLRHRAGRLTRATLCVLEPGGGDDARGDHAEWFAVMLADADGRG